MHVNIHISIFYINFYNVIKHIFTLEYFIIDFYFTALYFKFLNVLKFLKLFVFQIVLFIINATWGMDLFFFSSMQFR